MTPEQVLEYAKTNKVEFFDFWHIDAEGGLQRQTLPAGRVTAKMLKGQLTWPLRTLRADLETAFLDPFAQYSTLSLFCARVDPRTNEVASDDPRGVLGRAAAAAEHRLERLRVSARAEFFLFDQVSFEQGAHRAHYHVESREGFWRSGRDEPDNLGTQIRADGGGSPLTPQDSLYNLRSEIELALAECRVETLGHAHGPATGGHAMVRLGPRAPQGAADAILLTRYVARNVAARHGRVATFMPNPLFGQPGSRLGLWLELSAKDQAEANEHEALARWAIGGLLHHAHALAAFARPTTNSHRQASPPPMQAALSLLAEDGQYAAFIDVDFADASCQPHLTLSALLQAARDGIQRKLEPAKEMEVRGADDGGGTESRWQTPAPVSLEAALDALSEAAPMLQQDGVLPEAPLRDYIEARRAEARAVQIRPHPHEFSLYFNI